MSLRKKFRDHVYDLHHGLTNNIIGIDFAFLMLFPYIPGTKFHAFSMSLLHHSQFK